MCSVHLGCTRSAARSRTHGTNPLQPPPPAAAVWPKCGVRGAQPVRLGNGGKGLGASPRWRVVCRVCFGVGCLSALAGEWAR